MAPKTKTPKEEEKPLAVPEYDGLSKPNEETASVGVWTPDGSLLEQVEKQKLINEGKLARE